MPKSLNMFCEECKKITPHWPGGEPLKMNCVNHKTMKTGIELIAQERKGITELRLCLEQGIQQCRDADDMDSCSFGYEKGVLITGNDAVYLLTLINQSLNKEQPQKLSPSEQKKNDPWYPSEGETDWIGVGAKKNQPQPEKVDDVQWQDIMTTAAGIEPQEAQGEQSELWQELWTDFLKSSMRFPESFMQKFELKRKHHD